MYGSHGHRPDSMRIMSMPLKIHWMGWTATTESLFRAGWDMSAHQDMRRRGLQIAIKYEKDGNAVRGLSQILPDFDFRPRMLEDMRRDGTLLDVGIQMQVANNIAIHQMASMQSAVEFSPIDARPTFSNMEIKSFDELCHFKKNNTVDTHEIFLQQASLAEVMQIALDKQAPRQAEIRAEMMHRDKMEEFRRDSEPKAELRLVI